MYDAIYEEMRKCEHPLYIWGNGSMAHVVYHKLQSESIPVKGYFVNVNTQWQEQHEDMIPCLTLQQLYEKQLSFAVVMGHGHIELMSEISQEDLVKKVYVIPNPYDYYVPKEDVIKRAFEGGIDEVSSWLVDAESRDNLWAYFEAHSENYRGFYQKARMLSNMFHPDVWQLREAEVYYDIGAWNGDTIREFLQADRGKSKAIEAFEPDPIAYRELANSVQENPYIICHQIGLSSVSETMRMHSGGTQSAFMENGEKGDIPVRRLDELANEISPPTLIKIGVPRLTLAILHGAVSLIGNVKPRLILSVAWGNGNDLLDTIKWVHDTNPEYKLALRYRLLMPTQLWLYAY